MTHFTWIVSLSKLQYIHHCCSPLPIFRIHNLSDEYVACVYAFFYLQLCSCSFIRLIAILGLIWTCWIWWYNWKCACFIQILWINSHNHKINDLYLMMMSEMCMRMVCGWSPFGFKLISGWFSYSYRSQHDLCLRISIIFSTIHHVAWTGCLYQQYLLNCFHFSFTFSFYLQPI